MNTIIKHTMTTLFVISAAAMLLAGCTRSVKLTVINGSTSTLTNITASGTGFSVPFNPLAPGARQQITLNSQTFGKEAFKLEFDAAGKHFSQATSSDPWNGMKEIIMTVSTDFSMSYGGVTTF